MQLTEIYTYPFLDIIWHSLTNVAKFEGNSVGDIAGQTLQQCKKLCNQNVRCNSFAIGNSWCHLKDKCIDPSEIQKVNGYRTYYKNCDGNVQDCS